MNYVTLKYYFKGSLNCFCFTVCNCATCHVQKTITRVFRPQFPSIISNYVTRSFPTGRFIVIAWSFMQMLTQS